MEMKNLCIIVGVSLVLAEQGEAKTGLFGKTSIIPQFPKGVWDGSCDPDTLMAIPLKCDYALNENSTIEEKFACTMYAQPNTPGLVPIGAYPMGMTLDTELTTIDSTVLSPIFTDCALAKMIDNGCFSYLPSTWSASTGYSKYATEDEYANEMSSSYSYADSGSVGIAVVSVRAGVSEKNAKESKSQSTYRTAGVNRYWKSDFATLSMNTCLRSSAVKDLELLDADLVRSFNNDYYREGINKRLISHIVDNGFFVPSTYAFAIQYSSDVNVVYEATSTESSSLMEKGLEAGVEAEAFGAHGGVSGATTEAIQHSSSGSSVHAVATGTDWRYGECDFDAILRNPETWSNVLEDCAKDAAANVLDLDHPTYVPAGGFTNILELFYHAGLTFVHEPDFQKQFADAMSRYYSYCTCEPEKVGSTTLVNNCFFGNGTLYNHSTYSGSACERAFVRVEL